MTRAIYTKNGSVTKRMTFQQPAIRVEQITAPQPRRTNCNT